MDINIDAYTVAQLQVALSIVEQIDPDSGVVGILRAAIARRTLVSHPSPQVSPRLCPTPGCYGVLAPWPKSSLAAGVSIVGCLLCRYSRMDVDNG